MVVKIIQNLANGVYFGQKEKFMLPFNEVIKNNMSSRNLFLDALAINKRDVFIPEDIHDYSISDDILQ